MGDTQKADFLALNPFHAIPTLKHGDYSLAESNAILRYIAETSAPDTYDAKDATKSGLTDWAMDYAGGVLYADCYATLYPIVGYAAAPSDTREAADKVEEHLKAFVDVFLKGKFVGGDKPCIADYKVAPFFYAWGMDEVQELGITVPDKIKEFNTAFAEASKTGADTMKALGDFIKAKLTEKKGIFSFFRKSDIKKMGTTPLGGAPEQADFSGATEEPDKEKEPASRRSCQHKRSQRGRRISRWTTSPQRKRVVAVGDDAHIQEEDHSPRRLKVDGRYGGERLKVDKCAHKHACPNRGGIVRVP